MDDELIQRLKAALPSRYAVEEEIGRGGMAVVYRAEDRKHGRPVALKIVRPELASTIGIDRFLREIEVVARLQHPNVLTLIDSGEADGLPWYVTPYIAGQSLRDLLAREGALPVDRAVEIARGVADALEAAHREEVVHRDIKPGNVLLSGGHPVVSDFGVAAALGEASDGRLTETGVSVGSPVYMSPEQASGEGVIDARTDLYALGCVLYEMLAGRPPFEGPVQAVLTRKFTGEVEPLRALRPEVPDALAAVVERAMAVDPDDRFGSVAALRDALGTARLAAAPSRARVGRPILVAAVLGVTVLVGAVAVIRDVRADAERRQWAAEQIARVEDLADQGRYPEALALAEEVEAAVPGDTALANLLPRISFTVPIRTEPAGARVLIQPMDGPEDAWDTLGITPLPEVRFAGLDFVLRGPGDSYLGYRPSRLRFEREGYRTRELLLTAILGGRWRGMEPLGAIVLVPEDSAPEDMVRIPGFTWGPIEHGPYFLDRHEVTNAEFADFVEAGGYRDSSYWAHPFVREGRTLGFEEAMRIFEDQTGRSGPAGWRLGTYPEGREDYPVRGVSWHEAAAFARWAGRELPSRRHWDRGRLFFTEASHVVVPRSNLGGDGPRPVGENRAMTPLGAYDMVGNVREWVSNPAAEGERGTVGGAWTDPPFAAYWVVPRPAFDRDPTHGFRLMLTSEDTATLARLREPLRPVEFRDYRSEEPVTDAEFAVIQRLYEYDPVPPEPVTERVDTAEHWVRELVSFDRPYAERGVVALYLPRRRSGPFQPVLYWGGSSVRSMTSVDQEFTGAFEFIVRSGRAVAVPLLAGTYGRSLGDRRELPRRGSVAHRDLFIEWVKDYRTTLDYLETRPDIDTERVGYFGLSWGGATAPVLLAVEPRIDAAVLNVGGLSGDSVQPEVDPFNFISRVETPLLMISGEHDTVFPYETSQRPLFEHLGTDPENRKHYLSQASHLVPHDDVIRETLDWYDRYLGPPERR